MRLETRVGRSDQLVPLVVEECGRDLIGLGWSQEVQQGRAPVVRGTLERSHVPVVLIPVRRAQEAVLDEAAGSGPEALRSRP